MRGPEESDPGFASGVFEAGDLDPDIEEWWEGPLVDYIPDSYPAPDSGEVDQDA